MKICLTFSRSSRSLSSSRCRTKARSSASSACCCKVWIFLFTASKEVTPVILDTYYIYNQKTKRAATLVRKNETMCKYNNKKTLKTIKKKKYFKIEKPKNIYNPEYGILKNNGMALQLDGQCKEEEKKRSENDTKCAIQILPSPDQYKTVQ